MGWKNKDRCDTLIIVSDLHCGCQVGLCPKEGIRLDENGWYKPNEFQEVMWKYWREFWDEWVPFVTSGKPYTVISNGDAIDGEHHGNKSAISTNKAIQVNIAEGILKPIVDMCDGRFYMIRGTEVHDGTSAENVENLAKKLGAKPNRAGQYARYELWKKLGGDKALTHIMHHIGVTGSSAYESTAVYKELVESFVEAGRWGDRPPDVIVRSHRHRYFKTEIATANDRAMSIVTPAWQGKTPFVYKIPGGRVTQPQFGGVMLRISDEGELYERHFVKRLARPEAE